MFLLPLAFWLSSLWIYLDAKKWRSRGVRISPGFVAGLLLFAQYVLSILANFVFLRYEWRWLQAAVPIALFGWYLYTRASKYRRAVEANPPPLPPASPWGKWFFIVMFFLPLLLVAAVIVILMNLGLGF